MHTTRDIGRSLELVHPSFSAFFRSEPAAFVFPCTPLGGPIPPHTPSQYRRARNLINAMFAIIIPVTIFWQDKVFSFDVHCVFLICFLFFFLQRGALLRAWYEIALYVHPYFMRITEFLFENFLCMIFNSLLF